MFSLIGKIIRFVVGLGLLIFLILIVAKAFGISTTDISNKFSGIGSAIETKTQQVSDVADKTKNAASSIADSFTKINDALGSFKTAIGLSTSTASSTTKTETTPAKTETKTPTDSTINADAIIALTNAERAKAGKSKLTYNAALAASANLKVNDLFKFQYFEHVSPKGTTTVDLAKAVGYNYKAIGENLAGGFDTSEEVMNGWMNSPGHKANILSDNYTEIGVAVKKGMFKGENQWLAVQEFGKQLPKCALPDATLKAAIDQSASVVSELDVRLDDLKKQLSTMDKSTQEYQTAVKNYNVLVDDFNTLLAKRKQQAEQYNLQVNTYNTCNA